MLKVFVLAAAILSFATVSFAQSASAPKPAASSSVKEKWRAAKKRHPAASAVNPETSPDKKGGN